MIRDLGVSQSGKPDCSGIGDCYPRGSSLFIEKLNKKTKTGEKPKRLERIRGAM